MFWNHDYDFHFFEIILLTNLAQKYHKFCSAQLLSITTCKMNENHEWKSSCNPLRVNAEQGSQSRTCANHIGLNFFIKEYSHEAKVPSSGRIEAAHVISAFALAGTSRGLLPNIMTSYYEPNDVTLLQSYSLAYFFLGPILSALHWKFTHF